MESREFAVGDVQIGQASGKAEPDTRATRCWTRQGQVQAVIGAGLEHGGA